MARENGGRSWLGAAGSNVWYFFNSLKLTISVLISLAVVSILGTVIEQNKSAGHYAGVLGAKWAKVVMLLHVNNLFHSWWYTALLLALAANIVVCTFERFPPKWKSLLNHKQEKFDPRIIEKFAHNRSVSVSVDAATANARVGRVFKKMGFNVITSNDGGDHFFYAWKGALSRLGSDLTHVSLLLILAGSIIGSYAGYKDYRFINVGDTIEVPNAGFKLRLDNFWIDQYDTGQVKQYNSLVTVIDGGKEALTKQIWVNEPLAYKGIRFYQSDYGMAWDKIDTAYIAPVKRKTGDTGAPVPVKWGTEEKLPGTRYSVKVTGYLSDFAYDEKTNSVGSLTPEPNNPAVRIEIYNAGRLISAPWIFLKYPGIFPAIPADQDVDIAFTNYKPTLYSGLSVNKDPGTNIVWAGAIVMGVGFIFAFFMYHRRVWVHVKETGGRAEVRIGGMINKNTLLFEKELCEIAEYVEKEGKKT
ncbi:MAG: cytochrome c biogenesis protein ResB [Deltaproteobacteria bacterium]|nr:cytochrome c biogenesis protein ResB [Deltaproteobacteria bacterium]